ncbi:hypothetical protein FRACA_3220005 [Frankia canadensis]|uniref:Uncharacterized protein n=1 Tax=Frankia canadensis TaxID=1836972 RepID=A0A2I2KUN2_9ACTN|nr:hypothetical protein FRACA_3220005 [Frankia canadensis]SOU56660.1 hypothetical protein FRACA_3220005 [Frankia canadensis]
MSVPNMFYPSFMVCLVVSLLDVGVWLVGL